MDYLICGTDSSNTGITEPCPRCRRPGLPVKSVTVASLAKEEKLPLPEREYFLCVTPECPVAYYDEAVLLEEKDLQVPVWFKQHTGPVLVCYCAGVTDAEILAHLERGCCSSLADIQNHTGANTGGQCLTKNPAGR